MAATAEAVDSLDALYSALAKRVNERVNEGGTASSNDFVVTPFPFGEWEIGTVLRQNRSSPVTYTACSPAPGDSEIKTEKVPTLFPSYIMNRDVGIGAGLDEGIFSGLSSRSGSTNSGDGVQLSIAGASTQLWSDVGFTKALATASCRGVLTPGMTYWLVRGIVSGRREFTFSIHNGAGEPINVPAVGNLQVSVGAGNSGVTVSDVAGAGFLALVSQFTAPVAAPDDRAAASLASAPVVFMKPIAAVVKGESGKVYIRRDSDDSPDRSTAVISRLLAAHFDVASRVENVPSDRMPTVPQVRYFRVEDLGKARQVLAIFKTQCSDARLVALRIPLAPGQIEVWLPKVGRR